jgi:hypothetical protein
MSVLPSKITSSTPPGDLQLHYELVIVMRQDSKFMFRWLTCETHIYQLTRLSCNQRLNYRVHNKSPFAPVLNKTNPVHISHISLQYILISLSHLLLNITSDPLPFYCPNFLSSESNALSRKCNKQTFYKKGPWGI